MVPMSCLVHCDCMSRPDWLHLVHVNLFFLLLIVFVFYVPTCTLCQLFLLPVVFNFFFT